MPTEISWADETINFSTGCSGPTGTPEAPAPCEFCYGPRMAIRLRSMAHSAHKYRRGFLPTFHKEELGKFRDKAKRWRKPKRIFVNSMSDIMDPAFTDTQIRQVIDVARELERHVFMFLSKRPARYVHFAWPHNAWLGASATDQEMADEAMPALIRTGHSTTFLSCEPLLGPIALDRMPTWVIIGAQTGPKAVPPRREWVQRLTHRVETSLSTECFHKPNLEKHFGDRFVLRDFPITMGAGNKEARP